MQRLLMLAAVVPSLAMAGPIYHCVKNGQAAFQDVPCEAGARTARRLTPDSVTVPMLVDELRAGMTVEEVRRKLTAVKEGSGQEVEKGMQERLRVGKVMYEGRRFEAFLYFTGDRFARVDVVSVDIMDNQSARMLYDWRHAQISQKYGAPQAPTAAREPGEPPSAQWYTASGKAWVRLVPVTPTTSRVEFGFAPIN